MDAMSKNSVIAKEICDCRTKADINACRIQGLERDVERLQWRIRRLLSLLIVFCISVALLAAAFLLHWIPQH